MTDFFGTIQDYDKPLNLLAIFLKSALNWVPPDNEKNITDNIEPWKLLTGRESLKLYLPHCVCLLLKKSQKKISQSTTIQSFLFC